MFAAVGERTERSVDINAGQTVRMTGTVYDAAGAAQAPGGIDPEARQVIQGQPAFFYVRGDDVQVVQP